MTGSLKCEMDFYFSFLLYLKSQLRIVSTKGVGAVCVLIVPSVESHGAVYRQLPFQMNGIASG